MANFIFNIAKGAFVEKIRDGATVVGVMLLKVSEADGTLKDYDTLAAILGGSNTEADFTNYARKTGLTATITVDDTNDRVDVDLGDQTFSSAGGASNNTLTDAIIFYEESAADSGRIPLACLDCAVTTDGNDLTLLFNAAGFGRASDA